MILWDSENDKGPYPIKDDCFTTMLDGDNGVLILASYQVSGSRTTNLLFFGPNADKNAQTWDTWNPETAPDINTKTAEAIEACFGS